MPAGEPDRKSKEKALLILIYKDRLREAPEGEL